MIESLTIRPCIDQICVIHSHTQGVDTYSKYPPFVIPLTVNLDLLRHPRLNLHAVNVSNTDTCSRFVRHRLVLLPLAEWAYISTLKF